MKKVNVAELLRDCPSGMELDCTMYDDVVFHDIVDRHYPIRVRRKHGGLINLNAYGCMDNKIDSKCVIFPKCKTTWEGFHRPFKDGDIAISDKGDIHLLRTEDSSYCAYRERSEYYLHKFDSTITTRVKVIRFATEEEKQKLFDAIKSNGYQWNSETKTLEKLIELKFKVGDRIRNKKTLDIFRITNIDEDSYYCGLNTFWICDQDNFELVPNKFDINTLVPFESKVLVRSDINRYWIPAFWGFKHHGIYCTTKGFDEQCIPYEGNEYLLGTTDDCDEYFKTWQ